MKKWTRVAATTVLLGCLTPANWSLSAEPQPPATGLSLSKPLDVPYVPTPEHVVAEMIRLAGITRHDVVYDLGSGDGRILITAARKSGARGVGIDINPQRIAESRANAKAANVQHRVKFVEGDLYYANIRPATVVTMYLLPTVNLKLRPKLLDQLAPGTRIVSHNYDLGAWKPQKTRKVGTHTIYVWVVPSEAEKAKLRKALGSA